MYAYFFYFQRIDCADSLPLPKSANPQNADTDLRPISLTPVLSKILESFIFKWNSEIIFPHVDSNQYGNVKGCSTTHARVHLIHQWFAATDKPHTVIRSCMIDFSKAFYTIDHNILLNKLQRLGVHPLFIHWCADVLQHRYLRVILGSFKSSWNAVHAGVPQGTKLGPLFFLVMINDLTTRTPIYKYVDDCSTFEFTAITHISHLQVGLNEICNWITTNNMQLNYKMTKELRISFLKQSPTFDHLLANGT